MYIEFCLVGHVWDIFKPVVAGAVLQTRWLLIHSLIQQLILSHPKRSSQRPQIFKEGSPPPTCNPACVTCHVSHVTGHMSHFFFYKEMKLVWRVCYQRGLPRLVWIQKVPWQQNHK